MNEAAAFRVELLQRQNKQLREQVEELTETVQQLRAQLLPDRGALPEWLPPLTTMEKRLLTALASGRVMPKDRLHEIMYSDDPNGGPQTKIVDVFVCKLRRKLSDFISIETVWGQGYRLHPEAIELLWPSQREAAA